MKNFFGLVKNELLQQSRSAVVWLMLALFLAFWFTDLRGGAISQAQRLTSVDAPTIVGQLDGVTFDVIVEGKKALELKPFSYFSAISQGDRLGLFFTFFFAFITPFVLHRDKRLGLSEVIHAKPVSSSRYILSKMVALNLIAFAFALLSLILVSGQGYQLSKTYMLSYRFSDFLLPTFLNLFFVTSYIIAFSLLTSLLLRSGIGALLLQIVYWFLCITQMYALNSPVNPVIFFVWLIRSAHPMSPRLVEVLELNVTNLILNRVIHLALLVLFIALTIKVYDKSRTLGTQRVVTIDD